MKQLESTLNSALPALPDDIESVDGKLNYRQRLFVIRYTQHYNPKQAAIEAGYGAKGAHNKSSELLKKPEVREAILKRQYALQVSSGITKEYVLCELAEIFEQLRNTEKHYLQLKALDMIAKVAGFHTPDTQVNIQNNIESIKIEIVRPKQQQDGSQS